MATVAKILGQSKPTAANSTLLYTAPSGAECQGTLTICNQSTNVDKVRFALVLAGEVLDSKHYLMYDTTIPANSVIEKTFDIGKSDTVYVYTTNGYCSFTACGLEIS